MISIIIPAINEAARLAPLLQRLAAEQLDHEVIVIDGGSSDGTEKIARASGACVIQTGRGRGRQLFEGVKRARGKVLLFLHADSAFPPGGLGAIVHALASRPEAPGGNFRLLFDGGDGFSRWLDGFYAWLRARGIYYGDSGIFVRRDVFDRIGGIRPIPLMEDYDFVRRLEKAGDTLCIGEPALVTSSRRFRERHPVAIVMGWVWIHALYHLGVSPALLARLYDSDRRREKTSVQEAESFSPQSYS